MNNIVGNCSFNNFPFFSLYNMSAVVPYLQPIGYGLFAHLQMTGKDSDWK